MVSHGLHHSRRFSLKNWRSWVARSQSCQETKEKVCVGCWHMLLMVTKFWKRTWWTQTKASSWEAESQACIHWEGKCDACTVDWSLIGIMRVFKKARPRLQHTGMTSTQNYGSNSPQFLLSSRMRRNGMLNLPWWRANDSQAGQSRQSRLSTL